MFRGLHNFDVSSIFSLSLIAAVILNDFRPLLLARPDIVVGTPSKILAHVEAKNLQLKQVEFMVNWKKIQTTHTWSIKWILGR